MTKTLSSEELLRYFLENGSSNVDCSAINTFQPENDSYPFYDFVQIINVNLINFKHM